MTDTEQTFTLDKKHQALRSGNRWAIQRQQPDGSWDMIDNWQGGRRSLIQWAERHGIAIERDTEAALELIPESDGFRERG